MTTSSTATPIAPPRAARRRFPAHPADHRFFGAMSVAAGVVILAGFARTYGPKLAAGGGEVPSIVHLHAALFSAWLVLLVVQTRLVGRRIDLHRRLGTVMLGVAAAMLVAGVATAVVVTRGGHRGIPGLEFPDPGGFLLLNVASIGVFAVLVAAGWAFRRSPQAHKRLMLGATVGGLMPPGISRLPLVAGHPGAVAALVVAFLLAAPAWDLLTRRRVHPASALVVALTLSTVPPPIVTAFAATPAWHAVARWLL